MSNFFDLYISIGSVIDKERNEILIYQLADDLRELNDVHAVEILQTNAAPDGTKGGLDVNGILVKIAEVGGISSLISVIGSWLARDKSRSLKLQLGDNSIEVTGISQAEQRDLLEWFKVQASLRFDK